MKNKRKKKIDILKNISTLKKGLLNQKIISNDCILDKNVDNASKTHSSNLSYKININTDDEENVKEILEKLYQEELNKLKMTETIKEKLKNINLIEDKAEYLYNWDSLLNRKISSKKRDEKQNILKKKFNSFNVIDYKSIDYSKGKNVLSQIPNEIILNYYKELSKIRKKTSELSPKVKIKHKNNISNLIAFNKLVLSDKEKILNFLILTEKEINNFTDHELKIAAKRKTAEVLIKSPTASIVNNTNKINENAKNKINHSDKNIKKSKTEKKRGLILSLYDEDNPYIKEFYEEKKCLSLDSKNKSGTNIFDLLEKNINKTIKRNIFSAKNSKSRKFSLNNMSQDKDGLKNYSSGTTNESVHTTIRNIQNKKFNSFKIKRNKILNNFSVELTSNKTNNTKRKVLFRSMSFSNKLNLNNNKLYFINNKSNKNILSNKNFNEIGFMNVFPRKHSSKVGNIIYDKINSILKYRLLKSLKLNEKYYTKNLISKTINSRYQQKKEESKNNKLIQTFLSENLRTSTSKTIDSDMLSNISNCKENEKKLLKGEHKNKIKRNVPNFFSCSNNYIVNIKRKNKNKFLNELSDQDYLNNMMNEYIYEDKFTKTDSTKKIKSIYNHNNKK